MPSEQPREGTRACGCGEMDPAVGGSRGASGCPDHDPLLREETMANEDERICRVCGGPLNPEDEGPECDPTGCPSRDGSDDAAD